MQSLKAQAKEFEKYLGLPSYIEWNPKTYMNNPKLNKYLF